MRRKAYTPPAETKQGESAKDLVIKTIHASIADEVIKGGHYSGKVAASSTLHFGVFWKGELEGVMQYGHPIDKRKSLTLVKDTPWSGFLELNRMWFGPKLPKNAESRALAISLRLIKKHAPHIKWVISYADATQCGSGTIYRASGFLLTGIRKNSTILYVPSMKETFTKLTFTTHSAGAMKRIKAATGVDVEKLMAGSASVSRVVEALDAKVLKGYQIRYIYFLDKSYRDKLTVPVLDYSEIHNLDLPEGVK